MTINKHVWEPTDNQGHDMQCDNCHRSISIGNAKDWDKHINADCPGIPVA